MTPSTMSGGLIESSSSSSTDPHHAHTASASPSASVSHAFGDIAASSGSAGSTPIGATSVGVAADARTSEGVRPRDGVDTAAQGAAADTAGEEVWMPWCGVLISTVTLATRLDLGRYEGNYIRDTITAELACKPGESVVDKLMFFLKLKFHPLLIDEGLNGVFGTSLNLYHIYRLCAMKFCCHVRLLPPKRRVSCTNVASLRM